MKHLFSVKGLTFLIWFGSLFIRLYVSRSRGEEIPIYGYSLYGWLIALWREPGEMLTRGMGAMVICAFICACHVALCLALAWVVRRPFSGRVAGLRANHRQNG